MTTANNGGFVHPVRIPVPGALHVNGDPPPTELHPGMTLRDYFAAKAMQGYLASFDPHGEPVEFATKIAEYAYTIAAAMLKAREAAPEGPQQ